jgi:23S rRNA (uracil1939-C5)-methyltransferase
MAQGLRPSSPLHLSARLKSRPDTGPAPDVGTFKSVQTVHVEKPVYGGTFLSRAGLSGSAGKAVFVPLALPGETARVRVMEEKRGYAAAEIEEIVTASPQRVAPACRHFGACGGCHYQHTDYATQLGFKQAILRETLQRGGVRTPETIEVLAAEPWAYRNRIRVAFDADGRPGYRGRRSHTVVPIAQCPIAAPLLVRSALAAAEIVRASHSRFRISELTLFCNSDETQLLAGLVVDGGVKGEFEPFAQALAARIPELQGTQFEIDGRPAQRIGEWGASSLFYRAAGFDLRVDQGAFFQVNRRLIDDLVRCVTAGQSGALAWDLFAGVGLFARSLAESFARVVAVESAPEAIAALRRNLHGTTAMPVHASTLEFLRTARKRGQPDLIIPDLIAVDPPRTGLDAETAVLIAEIAAPALTYVSCDPATLARDLRVLIAGGYAIESITLADLFPQTFHLESVVRLKQ